MEIGVCPISFAFRECPSASPFPTLVTKAMLCLAKRHARLTQGGPMKALISLYANTGIGAFARSLAAFGFTITATSQTALLIKHAGVSVKFLTAVVEETGERYQPHAALVTSPYLNAALETSYDWFSEAEPPRFWFDFLYVDFFPQHLILPASNGAEEDTLKMFDASAIALVISAIKGRRLILCDHNDRKPFVAWLEGGRQHEEDLRFNMGLKAIQTMALRYPQIRGEILRAEALQGFVDLVDMTPPKGHRILLFPYDNHPHPRGASSPHGDDT
jgi:AICAR transformylase/IMP cyclohydrolase PurH